MAIFAVLPLDAASALGGWIGRNIFSRLPPDRIARANLKAAFPEKSSAEIETILAGMWDNLGRTVGEYPHLDSLTLDGPDPRIQAGDLAAAKNIYAAGHGVLFLSAHLGNWEVLPVVGEMSGLDGAAVVRDPNNPYVARWIARQRARRGPKEQIEKHSGARRTLAQLRAGKAVYMLVDQRNDEGIAVPFFGRDAMTTPVPAALSLKLGVPVIYARNRRLGRSARFAVTVQAAPAITPSGDEAADTHRLTAAITAEIEAMVRDDPAQWLWIHRRWR